MRRIAVTAAALVAGCAVPAAAPATRHGIEVERERVTFGPHTSTVTVVTMPRPGGNRVLAPAIPGGIVSEGTATVSAVSKQLARHGTAVAINADLFEYATGQPSGLLIVDGEVCNQPQGERPSLQIDTNGALHTTTPRARGSLVLGGGRTLPFQVNVTTPDDGVVFYDRGWGPSAPSGAQHAIVGRLTSGRIDAGGHTWRASGEMRVVRTRAGSLPIPPDASPDELFQGAGGAAAHMGRVRRGQRVGVRYELGPLARNLESTIGGGPVLIRDGKIVFSVQVASKAFTSGQLRPPDARTAVAQLRDGRILFYAADRGDGSTGLTIEEVARDLHRRGAVTAMAFGSGGSTSVALNGRLLNQPADGVERPVGNQLVSFVGDRGHGQPVARVTVGSRQPGAPRSDARLHDRSRGADRRLAPRPARAAVDAADAPRPRRDAPGAHPRRRDAAQRPLADRRGRGRAGRRRRRAVPRDRRPGRPGSHAHEHPGRGPRPRWAARRRRAGPAIRRRLHVDRRRRRGGAGGRHGGHPGAGPADQARPPLASAPMELTRLVAEALAEDVGDGDVTTEATIPADAQATATIVQKEPGVIFGLEAARETFRQLDPSVRFTPLVEEGVWREGGDVARVEGPARALLTGERTALNLLGRLSGVATAAAIAARAVEGTGATVLDTRKTTPGLRMLEKAAVRAGGASNHRVGLFDAFLIKENHIAAAGGITQAVEAARRANPDLLLEVEVRNPQEIDEALAAGAPRLLLDNMTPAELRAAVAQVAGRAELEASGGVTLETLREVAETGVDFVSLGALTHSARTLDLSMLLHT